MEENDKKRLTEWLGLCWHDYAWVGKDGVGWRCKCGHETYLPDTFQQNRTFADPQDFFACFEKLVELGKLPKFGMYLWKFGLARFSTDSWITWTGSPPAQCFLHEDVLSRTESGHFRLCVLCVEWLKEGE
jgi:hypothetical protein